tara:strand:+ start:1030 stop:1800 length:771 start_codon:yes stop_codon:yes gene_type:complete
MALFDDNQKFIYIDPYVDATLETTGWALNFLFGRNEASMGLRKDMRDAILKLLQYEDGSLVYPDGIDNVPAPPPDLKYTLDEVYAGMTPEEKAAKEAALSQPVSSGAVQQQSVVASNDEEQAEGEAPPVQQSSSFSEVNPNVSSLNSMKDFNPVIGTPKTAASSGNEMPNPFDVQEEMAGNYSSSKDFLEDNNFFLEKREPGNVSQSPFERKGDFMNPSDPKPPRKSIVGPPKTSKGYGGLRPRSGGGGLSGNRIV